MNQKKRLTRGRKKTCKIDIENSQTSAARQLLNKPVDGAIFFDGEGLYEGASPGAVEAALISGKEVVGRLIKNTLHIKDKWQNTD